MSILTEIFDALSTVLPGQVHRNVIDQSVAVPVWPAILFLVVSAVSATDLCGDDDDEAPELRIQIDVVATTPAEADALRAQVIAAMHTLSAPAALDNWGDGYEGTTKTHRCRMDFLVHVSSGGA